MAKKGAFCRRGSELVFILLTWLGVEVTKPPGMEFVQGGLRRRWWQMLRIYGTILTSRRYGENSSTRQIIPAGQMDAIGSRNPTIERS
jgi:hypothetical protein